MATGTPFDFNQAGHPDDSTAGFEGAPRQRPGGLTAVCVIAIVLGGLGLCASLFGLASLAFQDKIEKFSMQQQTPPGMPNGVLKDQMEMQKKMQQKMMEVTHRYRGVTLGTTLLNLLCATSLLVGGIMTMKLNPTGRSFLVMVFVAVIVFEIVRLVIMVFMQLDMAAAMTAAFQGGPSNQAAAFLATSMKIGTFVGMGIGFVMALGKIVFYGIGASYLGRPKVRQLFERSTAAQM
jgi:hypothetical protein